MDLGGGWRPKTAAWCSSAAVPRAASGWHRRITKPLVRSTNQAPVKVSLALPKRRRLHARAQFQKVYAEGQRYDGRLLAAFLRKNDLSEHRLGVTASTKAVGKSVDRNRARRLLRELFRRSTAELAGLQQGYDLVLNVKRTLPAFEESAPPRVFFNRA